MFGSTYHFAIALVLSAALLHAVWNALVKGSGDRMLTMAMIIIGHGIPGLVMVFIYLPPAAEAWPFLIASTFIHFFYYGFLILAYRFGDLSQVYPIARGSAPIMVAVGAQLFAGEFLPPLAWAGILLVSFGIVTLLLDRKNGKIHPQALLAAILTGFTIASYSIVDGLGVRASQSPLGYIGWLFVLETIAAFVLLYVRRHALTSVKLKTYAIGFFGGVISALAYGLVIYAKNLTTLGTVSAIRESSVIIAALIGVIWLGERPWQLRVLSAVIVATGVILLASSG